MATAGITARENKVVIATISAAIRESRFCSLVTETTATATGKDAAKISSFKAQYGFTPDSIRPYELMHFHELEKQRQAAQDLEKLKEKAKKAPKRVKKLSVALLVCFMLIYATVIIFQIASSMSALFGG